MQPGAAGGWRQGVYTRIRAGRRLGVSAEGIHERVPVRTVRVLELTAGVHLCEWSLLRRGRMNGNACDRESCDTIWSEILRAESQV